VNLVDIQSKILTIALFDMEDRFCIGQENSDEAKEVVIADFRTGAQIAFVHDSYALDYAPISKCILRLNLSKPFGKASQRDWLIDFRAN